MKVKVKICGIRSLHAALVAVTEGADFIGFNFVPTSKRYIKPEAAKKIIDHVKGKVHVVGIFQNAPFEEVNDITRKLNLAFVQLHGNEDNAYINKIAVPVIKSIHEFQPSDTISAEFLLLDRKQQGQGEMVDFNFAKHLTVNKKVFFAGGVTPESVASIIKQVKPFAVDVAGGIETDGKEDLDKVTAFIRNAKGVTI